MIKRSRVRILAGAAEQFSSSPGSASTSVLSLISVYVLPQCYRSNTKKTKKQKNTVPVILPKVQVAVYS